MKKNKLDIVYEDKHLLLINKPSNMLTINTSKNEKNLYSEVYNYLHKKNQKVFIVNRLDKDTSGIVVFAKSEKVKNMLQNSWDKVIRKYIAIVHGKANNYGIIKSYLKESKSLYTYSTNDKKGKYAVTEYKNVISNNKYSMLEITLKTGRKNQIRVHMKDNNTPIVGDKKYGIKDDFKNMYLFAYKISFIHPITKEFIDIELGIPDKYNELIKKKISVR